MNVGEREWDILRAIRAGKKPTEIDPPLQGEYEEQFYERHKKQYDEMKKKGIDFCWSPVTD